MLIFFLSLGPVDLTVGKLILLFNLHFRQLSYTFYVGTLSPDTTSTVPTVTDNLFAHGTISENEIAISFEPITDSSGTQINGEVTWGVYIYYLKL